MRSKNAFIVGAKWKTLLDGFFEVYEDGEKDKEGDKWITNK